MAMVDNAVSVISKEVYTGTVSKGVENGTYSQEDIEKAVCAETGSVIRNCENEITVELTEISSLSSLPASDAACRDSSLALSPAVTFNPGAANSIVFMSSIDPDATKDLAKKAEDAGLRWVDSPLSGGAPKALIGELTLMAGGAAGDVADAHNVLKHVSSNYTHMGPVGAGQTTKLINQVLCGLGFLAVAEATQLALDAGVDAAKIPTALKGGRADSALLQEYMTLTRVFSEYPPSSRRTRLAVIFDTPAAWATSDRLILLFLLDIFYLVKFNVIDNFFIDFGM